MSRRAPPDPQVEGRLLLSLRNVNAASVDDLFDQLPADEVRCLIAGLGRKAIRVERAARAKKAGEKRPADALQTLTAD